MATIRAAVREAWREHGLDALSPDDQLAVALGPFEHRHAEDKLAGVLALSEFVVGRLDVRHAERLAEPFARGHIGDWGTCDWYCVKALGPFVEHSGRSGAEAIAAWRHEEAFWQRRAAAVSFVNLAPRGRAFYDEFPELLLAVCETNVGDAARFSQTAVGWLLRELSKAQPDLVARFVEEHREEMSAEALRRATWWLRNPTQPKRRPRS